MSFGDVASAAGLEKFNAFLVNNAYVSGWTPTQQDVTIFKSIKSSPNGKLRTTGSDFRRFVFLFGKNI